MCNFNNARSTGWQNRGFGAAQHGGFGRFARHFGGWQQSAPVNVREGKDWYEIFLYAPGLSKDAFQVNIAGEVLSVRFQPAEGMGQQNWLHHEYARQPFERQFNLHGKVDTTGISARYTDGVLELTLPKLPGSAGQDIAVA